MQFFTLFNENFLSLTFLCMVGLQRAARYKTYLVHYPFCYYVCFLQNPEAFVYCHVKNNKYNYYFHFYLKISFCVFDS